MNYQSGPDLTALRLARYIQGLDDQHMVSVPEDVARDVSETIKWAASAQAARQAQRDAELAKQDKAQGVLDADLPIAKGAHRCEASVFHRSGRVSGWGSSSACPKDATVVRTWTTREFDGLYLNGVKVDSADPRRYGDDAAAVAFDQSLERRYSEPVHQAFLCGTHRKIKGSYGYPY